MEATIDTIISELEIIREEHDFLTTYFMDTNTKFGDPGIVMSSEYPYLFVEPINDIPKSETMGNRGWDTRTLTIVVGLVLDVSDYFDATVEELPGQRQVVQIMDIVRRHLRTKLKRTLNHSTGVRNLVVGTIEYRPDVREPAFVMMGLLTVTVEKQYTREVD